MFLPLKLIAITHIYSDVPWWNIKLRKIDGIFLKSHKNLWDMTT